MPDWVVSMGINAIIEIARGDGRSRSKWRKALLKVFREIARAFKDDVEFAQVAETEL